MPLGPTISWGKGWQVTDSLSEEGENVFLPVRRIFAIALFLSGLAALTYQVMWQRVLTQVIGSDVIVVLIVNIFMICLGLGAELARRFLYTSRRSISTYALIEVMIGLYGVIFIPLMRWANKELAGIGNGADIRKTWYRTLPGKAEAKGPREKHLDVVSFPCCSFGEGIRHNTDDRPSFEYDWQARTFRRWVLPRTNLWNMKLLIEKVSVMMEGEQ
jgi:hypothetical protein